MSSAIAKVSVRSSQSVRQSETQGDVVDFPRGAHRARRQRQESEWGSGMKRLLCVTAFALVCRASMVAPRTGSESRMERCLWEYETLPSHGAKSLNPGWCHVWRCTGQFVACA